MAQLKIFIGYMGLIPEYHINHYPEISIEQDVKAKTHFVKSDIVPSKFWKKVYKHCTKPNKTSTNYEGTGLNKRK